MLFEVIDRFHGIFTINDLLDLFEMAKVGNKFTIIHPAVAAIRNVDGDTPLHLLARQTDDIEILKHPDSLTAKDKKGNTVFHIFASRGDIRVLRFKDAIEIKNNDGDTPLHCLARSGKFEILSIPEANKIKNNDGKTPKDYLKNKKERKRR